MWEPFRKSLEQWAPQCKIVYDKFHVLQHANDAVDEVRRAECAMPLSFSPFA
jgi:transposase